MHKKVIVTLIALSVGLLHFVTGENYRGPFPLFVNGYFIDILLPMTLYLLMGLFESKWIRSPIFRAVAVFLFGCAVETSQYLGRPFFGSIFDPWDILAYAGGVGLGLILDLLLFPRIVPRWNESA
jgi:ABC-type cobalamin transport system permease subunit